MPQPEQATEEQQAEPETKKPLTYEEWLDSTGLNKTPELKGYTNERREKRAQYQQDMYNMSKALRSLFQAASGSKGSYMSKFENDNVTPRLQNELARIREAKDADQRRIKLQNWTRNLRNAELFNSYKTGKENVQAADERQQRSIDAADNRFDKQLEYQDKKYDQQKNDRAAELEKKHKYDLEAIDRRGENNASLYNIRKQDAIDKPYMAIKDKDGNTVKITQAQAETAVSGYLKSLRLLYEKNSDDFDKVEPYIQNIIIEARVPSNNEIKWIMRDQFGASSVDSTGNLWESDSQNNGSLWE